MLPKFQPAPIRRTSSCEVKLLKSFPPIISNVFDSVDAVVVVEVVVVVFAAVVAVVEDDVETAVETAAVVESLCAVSACVVVAVESVCGAVVCDTVIVCVDAVDVAGGVVCAVICPPPEHCTRHGINSSTINDEIIFFFNILSPFIFIL